jgi:hypothetical protein
MPFAMMVRVFFSLHRVALLVALTVALVATGFAHRMPSAQDEAVTYALANGLSLADLCAGDLDGDGQRDPHCMACQIAGSAGLPPAAPGLIDLEVAFVARVIAPRENRAVARVLDPAHGLRAPPLA